MAYCVQFETDLSFKLDDTLHSKELSMIGFLKDGISYLPPGEQRKASIGGLAYSGRAIEEKRLPIAVTYRDFDRKEHRECFCLDFRELIGSLL